MSGIVPLFLLAPVVLVPLGYRLLDIVVPGSRPPAVVLRLMPVAAGSLVVSFWLPAGPGAAALAVPWFGITACIALLAGARLARDPDRFRPGVRHATDAAVAFLAVGATFAVIDRLGVPPFGLSATVILLTAVHFHFAGFVLPLAGALAYLRRPRLWVEGALGAVVVGIPVTALGFLGIQFAAWIGAVLTASGGFAIGLATIAVARTLLRRSAVALAVIAGASLIVSMPMAVAYATETLLGTAWLDIADMAAIHGTLNALGFSVAVMVAWTIERRARTRAIADRRPVALRGATTTIRLETYVAAPIERVFDLARDIGLHERSMAATGERAIAGRTSGPIEQGETVTWRARHFGVWWTMTSRITEVRAPTSFADKQERGPFAWFRHRHTFQAVPGGTVMTDDWEHASPFGPIGRVVDRVVLRPYMQTLLETRNAVLMAEAEADGVAMSNGGALRS